MSVAMAGLSWHMPSPASCFAQSTDREIKRTLATFNSKGVCV
ncbi:hypothetical protein ABH994_002855 [Bradyrhizobium yuanmingense]|uniref:Uncharacterized protein n=1 Tax=Bradyrhizobium yuanmingense TaxID=108015 RepID=A0ABV4GUZ2_9BRAD